MSERNIEIVRSVSEATPNWVHPDEVERLLTDELLAEFFDPEMEWQAAAQSTMAGETYRGYGGIRRFWTDLLSAWEEYGVEIERLIAEGDQVAVVMRMRGRIQGVEIDELWSSLWTLRDGKVLRIEGFTSPDGAANAAGLES
jgi:ketosteroid isomerase-like protein